MLLLLDLDIGRSDAEEEEGPGDDDGDGEVAGNDVADVKVHCHEHREDHGTCDQMSRDPSLYPCLSGPSHEDRGLQVVQDQNGCLRRSGDEEGSACGVVNCVLVHYYGVLDRVLLMSLLR